METDVEKVKSRIKSLMNNLGYPDSHSHYLAFMQLANEFSQGCFTEQQKTAEPCGDYDTPTDVLDQYPELKAHVLKLANTRIEWNISEWSAFLNCLCVTLAKQPAAPTQIDVGELEALIKWVDGEIEDYERARNMMLDETGYEPPDFGRQGKMKAIRALLSKLSGGV